MSPKMILVCLSEQELFSYRNAVSSAQEKDCVHRTLYFIVLGVHWLDFNILLMLSV